MKILKKFFVLGLAVIMCLTAMSITSFATEATFQPNVKLTRRYDTAGEKIYIGIVTDVACGAIKATLQFTDGATFVEADSEFAEEAAKADMYTIDYDTSSKIDTLTFVTATDNLSGDVLGDQSWAELCFTFGEGQNAIDFDLVDISVCDVDETLATGAIEVEAKKITVTAIMNALGSQYRATNPALRFGSKLIRNKENYTINIDGVARKTVSCGYVIAYSDKIGDAELGATIDSESGVMTAITGASIKYSSKYLASTNDYMIYTLAVTFSKEANKSREIQARPYVKYLDANGGYQLEWGDIIKNSYNHVEEISKIQNNTAA